MTTKTFSPRPDKHKFHIENWHFHTFIVRNPEFKFSCLLSCFFHTACDPVMSLVFLQHIKIMAKLLSLIQPLIQFRKYRTIIFNVSSNTEVN